MRIWKAEGTRILLRASRGGSNSEAVFRRDIKILPSILVLLQ